MKAEIKKCLFDIIQAIDEIHLFVNKMSYEAFVVDIKTQKAVEREFEIIGEALSRIRRMDEVFVEQITAYHRIIGFRNILAHGYDVVDDRIVWDAVMKHLPILYEDVCTLLDR